MWHIMKSKFHRANYAVYSAYHLGGLYDITRYLENSSANLVLYFHEQISQGLKEFL